MALNPKGAMLVAMASNLLAMASNLIAMASNLIAMAFNLLAMASNLQVLMFIFHNLSIPQTSDLGFALPRF